MKVQEAIKTIETLRGYKFIQRGRDYYTNQMNYYFRTSKGGVRVFSMGGLRIRAERERWFAENYQQQESN